MIYFLLVDMSPKIFSKYKPSDGLSADFLRSCANATFWGEKIPMTPGVKVSIDVRSGRSGQTSDFICMGGPIFVSAAFRQSIGPVNHSIIQFIPISVNYARKNENKLCSSHFLMNVLSHLNCIDEKSSILKKKLYGNVISYEDVTELSFKPIVPDVPVFRPIGLNGEICVVGDVAARLTEAHLKGFKCQSAHDYFEFNRLYARR